MNRPKFLIHVNINHLFYSMSPLLIYILQITILSFDNYEYPICGYH